MYFQYTSGQQQRTAKNSKEQQRTAKNNKEQQRTAKNSKEQQNAIRLYQSPHMRRSI
jgi:hypothetical protein